MKQLCHDAVQALCQLVFAPPAANGSDEVVGAHDEEDSERSWPIQPRLFQRQSGPTDSRFLLLFPIHGIVLV